MAVKKVWLLLLLVFNVLLAVVTADFTANCPQECKCKWASGSKEADCSISDFHEIPNTIDTEIQILDLTGNKLTEITKDAFKRVALINLKKLILKENNIRTLHKNGFSGLDIMILLDLSKNKLKTLHADTFTKTSRIRWIFLNGNQIDKLEDGLFNNLPFLLKVDLSDNRIVTVGYKTFVNVPHLNILKLDGNKLEHLQVETLNNLSSLSLLHVNNNPWRCDCNLLPFRNWVISKQLNTIPIICSEPPEVYGKSWKELDSSNFTCPSNIEGPKTQNSCQINGNTLPDVNWVLNTEIKGGVYNYHGEVKYYLGQGSPDNNWINLTISLCIDKNVEDDNKQHLVLAIAPTIPGVIVHQ